MSVRIDRIKLGITNCYLIRQDGVLLVDCGDAGRGDVFQRISQGLFSGSPHVDLVVLTHGHWDHIGSTPEILRLTGAKLAMHRAERRACPSMRKTLRL
jgi:hydroxyacylglutathione hydrolase